MEDEFNFTNFMLKVISDTFDTTDNVWLNFIHEIEKIPSHAYQVVVLAGLCRFVHNTFCLIEQMYGPEQKERFKSLFLEQVNTEKFMPSDESEYGK